MVQSQNRKVYVIVNDIGAGLGPLPWLSADLGYTIPELAQTTRKKCKKVMGLAWQPDRGSMVGMNKLKYWILVTAALVKVFTPAIATAGAAFVFNGTVLGDLCMVLGIISLGWINEVKLPEKPQ